METGANLETRTTSQTRPAVPLHPASKNGHEAVLEALLGARANPNARIVNGATLRIAAAVDGHVGAVRKSFSTPTQTQVDLEVTANGSTEHSVFVLDTAAGSGKLEEVVPKLVQQRWIEGCGGQDGGA